MRLPATQSFLQALPSLKQTLEVLWIEPASSPASTIPSLARISSKAHGKPTLVFLHEGLGSITQWRDFPQALCDATGLKGLAYARQGYGLSNARVEAAGTNFMHIEAHQVLPALLTSLKIDRAVLVGHSDGGSIALLFAAWAARCAAKGEPQVEALCILAPHLFVEPDSVRSIDLANQQFDQDPEFRERLGKHHRAVDAMFKNWANVWLSEPFKSWNIEAELADIACPILAIQGIDDQYGSLAHIRQIPSLVKAGSDVELLEIPTCKHSPHLEHRAMVLSACSRFLSQHVKGM